MTYSDSANVPTIDMIDAGATGVICPHCGEDIHVVAAVVRGIPTATVEVVGRPCCFDAFNEAVDNQ